MPLEIREIVIRANLQESNNSKEKSLSPEHIQKIKKEIVAYCLEKMEDKLYQKLER